MRKQVITITKTGTNDWDIESSKNKLDGHISFEKETGTWLLDLFDSEERDQRKRPPHLQRNVYLETLTVGADKFAPDWSEIINAICEYR